MSERPSTRVVRAVAVETGRDPIDLPPLGETVDPDALDVLFDAGDDGRRRERNDRVLRFSYAGREVTVRRGDVTVGETRPRETSSRE